MSSILPSKELLRERYKSSHTIFVIAANMHMLCHTVVIIIRLLVYLIVIDTQIKDVLKLDSINPGLNNRTTAA